VVVPSSLSTRSGAAACCAALALLLARSAGAANALPRGSARPVALAKTASASAGLAEVLSREVEAARRVARALGVHIVEVASQQTVYEADADEPRLLASNTKLLTTAAALHAFGPGPVFETKVLLRGTVDHGVLTGELAVQGSGDPNISGRAHKGDAYAVFRDWAAALKARGIARVTGDLVLSNGIFTDWRVHPDWPRDQLLTWYEAPIDALSFNENTITLRVWPGGKPGAPARVETVPNLKVFAIRNSARTGGAGEGTRLAIGREAESDTLIVSGTISARSGPVEDAVAVYDPEAYFGAALRDALAKEGIAIAGETRFLHGLPPGDWQLATSLVSELEPTISVTNKHSHNFFAESLLKTLGLKVGGEGTWARGAQAVADFLTGIGIPRASFSIADGSGLSRQDRMAPRAMTRLLDFMAGHRYSREFMLSLPYSGERDLKWRYRLASEPYRGNVFAKTGTISGVSTLSGYAKAKSGKLYAFSILCNQVRSTGAAMAAQDRIVRALIDRG